MLASLFAGVATLALSVYAQNTSEPPPNTFPHDYPGKPKGDFSPQWQNYYFVKDPLPNVTFPLSRSFAGTIPVNRPNHPNDTLFFWAFEHQNGSLTAKANERSDEPWAIWLNGGPGASSIIGMLLENGPLHVTEFGSMVPNNFSWDRLVDYVWVDQPVGTGYSTADSNGYIVDEDQMGEDFAGFLENLVKVFPSLAHRPLLLTGESYAGTYIPYITKTLFSMKNPPVKVAKIAMGNAAIGSITESEELPAFTVIETYPQIIGYDPEVYEYFKEQNHLCGYDLNLTYPQNEHFPSINLNFSSSGGAIAAPFLQKRPRGLAQQVLKSMILETREAKLARRRSVSRRELREREKKRQAWKREKREKRDLSGRANGTIDPWYGCFIQEEVMDYALNFSFPWSASSEQVINDIDAFGPFNPYDIPDARNPPAEADPSTFMNDNRTRAALHAPTSKDWLFQFVYPFNNTFEVSPSLVNPFGDPSVAATAFFSELATNASAHNVSVIIYSGNDDSVVAHFSSEVVIQNTTFGGIQGFTRKPQTPFFDDNGNFAGIVHQERGWTFALIDHAGHEVPEYNPAAALTLFREFILRNNKTGLLTSSGGHVSVVGGEDPSILQGDHNILQGQSSILFGSGTATSYFTYPSATIAAYESFYSAAVATPTPSAA